MRMPWSREQEQKLLAGVAKVRPEDEERAKRDYEQAQEKARDRGADPSMLDGLKTLWRMLNDPDYTMRWQTKALVIFAIGYFVSPVDAIPDVVPVVGYLDDALVVVWVLHQLQEEVAAYRKEKGTA